MTKDIERLMSRHRELDTKIKEAYTDYLDDASLSKMKQEKLQVKDQIEAYKVKK
jgi:uncharacterized protein YdcH (DUF465 family)